MPGWKRNQPKVLPKSKSVGQWTTRLNNWAALSVYTEGRLVGHRQQRGRELDPPPLSWDAKTGCSWATTAAAGRRRSISVSWPPASVTATIPGSTSATCSSAYRPCCQEPAKKICSLCCPTAGIRSNLPGRFGRRFLPTCFAGRLPITCSQPPSRPVLGLRRESPHRSSG